MCLYNICAAIKSAVSTANVLFKNLRYTARIHEEPLGELQRDVLRLTLAYVRNRADDLELVVRRQCLDCS